MVTSNAYSGNVTYKIDFTKQDALDAVNPGSFKPSISQSVMLRLRASLVQDIQSRHMFP
jgi:hypothetical protein